MNNNGRVLNAVDVIEKLNQMHERFMEFVETLSTVKSNVGTIEVSNNNLEASCLGITLIVKRKIVVKDGLPAFMEYSFAIPKKDSDLVVFSMYLGSDGVLFKDPQGNNRLCDYNNNNLVNNVLKAAAIELLDSEAFTPEQNG